MPIALTGMDSGANSANSFGKSPPPAATVPKGRGLRRWRRIPREQHDEGSPPAGPAAAASADEDFAQLHKRRHPVGADGPKGKHGAATEADSPVASVESSFVPPETSLSPARPTLDPDLGLLISSAGFLLGAGGADSDNSDDQTAKSSNAVPRHDFSSAGFGRERDRARSRGLGAAASKNPRPVRARVPNVRVASAASSAVEAANSRSIVESDLRSSGAAHSTNLRPVRVPAANVRAASSASSTVEAENSRSSVESDLRSSGAPNARKYSAGIGSNGVHKFLYTDVVHTDEEPPSEGLRSGEGGFYKENGSVVGRLVMGDSYASDHVFGEGGVGKSENGEIYSGLDPYVQSIALLQSAQEALEKEIQNFTELGKEASESSTANNSEKEWSSSPNREESTEELSEKLKLLESKLEEASTLIDEKDSRIFELSALGKTQPRESTLCNNEQLSLQSEIDQFLMEKMEAEIQCFILRRALRAWRPQSKDQGILREVQSNLPDDHKQLEVKLRHTENRATMLEEMVEKLELQCKELSNTSEVLKMQARASRASLFCSIQFVLLCIALGTFLVRSFPSSPEFVPT